MTVKELYEEAKSKGRENWEILIHDYYGEVTIARWIDWDGYAEYEEVFICD